jgi:hypothetical protein
MATPRAPEMETDTDIVSEKEMELWAEREKRRRKAWLEGPTEEEKRDWAERERRRRTPHTGSIGEEDLDEGRRVADRWQRDIGWAVAGLASRMIDSRYALLGNLVREGRQREDEYQASRPRRRRVYSDDDM